MLTGVMDKDTIGTVGMLTLNDVGLTGLSRKSEQRIIVNIPMPRNGPHRGLADGNTKALTKTPKAGRLIVNVEQRYVIPYKRRVRQVLANIAELIWIRATRY